MLSRHPKATPSGSSEDRSNSFGFLAKARTGLFAVVALAGGCEPETDDKKEDPTTSTSSAGESESMTEQDSTGVDSTGMDESADSSTGEAPEDTGSTTIPEDDSDGTTGTDTNDSTTGGSTGEVMPDCEEVCMADNMVDCEMDNGTAVCQCETGYAGDCSVCAPGYENQGKDGQLDCEKDVTPPTVKIETNGGNSPYVIAEKDFTFKGGCEGSDCGQQKVVEVYYRKNGLPMEGELDHNFKPGDTTWSKEYFDLIKDEANTYSVRTKDENGNFSEWKEMIVVRSF